LKLALGIKERHQLRILYFQPDYSGYQSSYYQHQFPLALMKVHQVFMYGPGYEGYEPKHTVDDVLKLSPFEPELICVGAGWERDDHPTEFNLHPDIRVGDVSIPSCIILNKEYKKLDQKFQFVVDNKIQIVFTAHHDHSRWQDQLGVRFIHFPFAVDANLFKDYGEPKRYDFGFSGSLHTHWIDLRLRVKQKLYWRARFKHPRYWFKRIYWGEWDSGHKTGEDYARLMNSSRMWLATPGAIDLVGTRFYEVMAVKSLLFCNRSPVYDGLFEDGQHCVMFAPDLSDFEEKLFYYLRQEEERQAIVSKAYRHVRERHTWDKRVEEFTQVIEQHFFDRNSKSVAHGTSS